MDDDARSNLIREGILAASAEGEDSGLSDKGSSAYLLERCPELTDMTGKQFIHLEKLGFTTANSNPLVFNLPGVNGLKTGSTNRAGYCVVTTLPVTVGGETHTIMAVVLGAETAELRGQGAEILLRCAKDHYEKDGF